MKINKEIEKNFFRKVKIVVYVFITNLSNAINKLHFIYFLNSNLLSTKKKSKINKNKKKIKRKKIMI